jgi:hypothetical protein
MNKVTLEVVRGDTFKLPLKLNSGTKEFPKKYTLCKGDMLYVGIMEPGQPFENATIRCALDETCPRDELGNTLLILNHSETKNLNPGKYYITVKFVQYDEVTTVLNQKLFFVTGTPIGGCNCE